MKEHWTIPVIVSILILGTLGLSQNAYAPLEVVKLTASDAAAFDIFGQFATISGDNVIVGARFNDDAGTNSGSAYIFDLAKEEICHKGKTITVSENALAAHLKHADTLGPCS